MFFEINYDCEKLQQEFSRFLLVEIILLLSNKV